MKHVGEENKITYVFSFRVPCIFFPVSITSVFSSTILMSIESVFFFVVVKREPFWCWALCSHEFINKNLQKRLHSLLSQTDHVHLTFKSQLLPRHGQSFPSAEILLQGARHFRKLVHFLKKLGESLGNPIRQEIHSTISAIW